MRLAHGILIADASIQFGIQIFKERRQHCGVETDALNRWERCLITRARYEFRGVRFRQQDISIPLQVTGDIARCYKIPESKKFPRKY